MILSTREFFMDRHLSLTSSSTLNKDLRITQESDFRRISIVLTNIVPHVGVNTVMWHL